jgi:membrane-associated phospholipid phosphatase
VFSRSRHPAQSQIGVFLAAYLLYDVARWITAGEFAPALRHAQWVVDVERSFGIAVERSVQRALDQDVVVWLLSNVYLAAQLLVVPASLIFLYHRNRAIYRRLRDTILATWLLAVPIYAAFPVAPPRLAGLGLADTVSAQAAVALTGHSTIFYNPYAAVPSLHCGFAFAIGIALAAAAKRPVWRVLALLWGPLVALTVVATGNHFVLDIVAGLLVAGAGYVIARLPERIAAAGVGGPTAAAPRAA